MNDEHVHFTVHSLCIYPVKSCAGIALNESLLAATGLAFDRTWMVIDSQGQFVTQRQLPRMTLIQPTLHHSGMVLRARGMLALHVSLDHVESPVRVTVWNDEVAAFDMGDLCAQWFSDFLGQPLRLVRFDPDQKRLSDRRWTGAVEAENGFSDGFPLLVTTLASIELLNQRLAAQGQDAVEMGRFRPNMVLAGLDAHAEDPLDELVLEAEPSPICLKLVKPCSRCTIPDIHPATGVMGHAVTDALSTYRADARLNGKITWGMNAVIVDGVGQVLRVGMPGRGQFGFD